MLSLLLAHRIDEIIQITNDGYGNPIETLIYKDVPCNYIPVSSLITIPLAGGATVEVKVVAEVIVDSAYSNIKPDYVIVFNGVRYKVVIVNALQTVFGRIHGYKFKLKTNG